MTTPTSSTHQPLLDLPVYNASVGQAVSRFWRKYATFDGRASRSEFWWWALVDTLCSTLLLTLAAHGATGGQGLSLAAASSTPYYLWNLVTLVPSIALTVRRLHDVNHSGLWLLLAAVPILGVVVLVAVGITKPDPAGMRYDRPVPAQW